MVVLAGVINGDIGVWESDLSTFVRDKYSGTMPPGAIIEMSPLPAWNEMTDFISGGECGTGNPHSCPIFNTQRQRRLQQAPRRRRLLLQLLAAQSLQGKALQMLPRSSRSHRTGGRKHGDKRHGSASSCISKSAAGVTGTNRNGSTSRVSNVGTDSSPRLILHGVAVVAVVEATIAQGGAVEAAVEAVLQARLLRD